MNQNMKHIQNINNHHERPTTVTHTTASAKPEVQRVPFDVDGIVLAHRTTRAVSSPLPWMAGTSPYRSAGRLPPPPYSLPQLGRSGHRGHPSHEHFREISPSRMSDDDRYGLNARTRLSICADNWQSEKEMDDQSCAMSQAAGLLLTQLYYSTFPVACTTSGATLLPRRSTRGTTRR